MGTAFSGLQAAQAALDITSQNIASIGVDGYSRQRVTQEAIKEGSSSWYLNSPGGVNVTGYQRIRDGLLDRRYYDQAPLSGDADTRASIMGQVEVGFAEPSDHGLQSLMDRFFNSWQGASNAPTSTPARSAVVDAATSLAQGFNQTAQMLDTTLTQISNEQALHTNEVIKMSDQIVSLTANIRATLLHGGSANSLQDERDNILDKMAQLGNISTTKYDNGSIDVSFGAFSLIDSSSGVTQGNTPSIADLNSVSAGKIYALNDLATNVLPGIQNKLDAMVSSIVTLVNNQHATGFDLQGNAGGDFFDATGTTANSITVASAIQASPGLLALSNSSLAKGNNSNALAMASLVNQANTVGTESINGSYGSLVSQLGSITAQANNQQRIHTSITQSVQDQRDGVSGVSLDEEMSNLIRYQQSYSAAAKVISTLNQVMDVLVNQLIK